MTTNSTITIAPALPCCSITGESICGTPATAAFIYPMGAGQYILTPICRSCVLAMAAVYSDTSHKDLAQE